MHSVLYIHTPVSAGSAKPLKPITRSELPADSVHYANENHLANVKQLTSGGDYAEAYFSFDNSMVSFQARSPAWYTPYVFI